MTNSISSLSNNRSEGLVELWLTPLIGLILLGPLIYHWRWLLAEPAGPSFANDWRMQLRENIGLDIVIGIVPLFAAACLQRLLRAWKWHGWMRGLAGGLIGCLLVGVFYYYALFPLSHWFKPYDEGEGNMMTVYVDHIFYLAFQGGFAVFTSFIVTSLMIKRLRKP